MKLGGIGSLWKCERKFLKIVDLIYGIHFVGSGWNESDGIAIVYCVGCKYACVVGYRDLFNDVAPIAEGCERLVWILGERC
jgi:hypothetical protein